MRVTESDKAKIVEELTALRAAQTADDADDADDAVTNVRLETSRSVMVWRTGLITELVGYTDDGVVKLAELQELEQLMHEGMDVRRRTLIAVVEQARCKRCLGRGIVGHMGVGHDPCPVCGGKGADPASDHNLVAALSDALWMDAESQRFVLDHPESTAGTRAKAGT